MPTKRDLLKIAIWISSGIVAGVLITIGIQNFMVSGQCQEASKTAAAETENNFRESAAAETVSATATPASKSKSAALIASPSPVSDALAVLNNSTAANRMGTNSGSNLVAVPPGMSYSETISGYPIFTGGRAIDQPISAASVQVQQLPAQNLYIINASSQPPSQPVGRNGLLSNPCVDPPSTHGLAYSRNLN